MTSRLTVTEPEPGRLRVEVRDEAGGWVLLGGYYSVQEVLDLLHDSGVTPNDTEMQMIERLAKRNGDAA